jgi:hypothetical protein
MNRWLPAVLIFLLLAAFRILGGIFPDRMPNFQPLLAVILCSLVFLKGAQRWIIPTFVWVITDPVTSLLQGAPIFGWHHLSIAAGIASTVLIARFARRDPSAARVLGSAALSAVVFYMLTNLISFASDPLYAKTAEGFVQSQWTGATGLGPTWIFLRNLMASNLIFTALFLAARVSIPQASGNSSEAVAR